MWKDSRTVFQEPVVVVQCVPALSGFQSGSGAAAGSLGRPDGFAEMGPSRRNRLSRILLLTQCWASEICGKQTKLVVTCDLKKKVFFTTSWCGRESMWHSQRGGARLILFTINCLDWTSGAGIRVISTVLAASLPLSILMWQYFLLLLFLMQKAVN